MSTPDTFPRTLDELRAFVRAEVRKALADLPRAAYAPPTLTRLGLFADDVPPSRLEELPVWARQEETGRP